MPESQRHLDNEGRVVDLEPDRHDPRAIVNCPLCDDDGYRGSVTCDHIDHAAATEHGRALARAALAEIQQRRADRARGVEK